MNDGEYPIPDELRSYKLMPHSAYQSYDYNSLGCRITGNFADVTVGDAVDHKTKVDLDRGVLEYHDSECYPHPCLSVAELFRSIGLKCKVFEGRGVNCTGVTAKKAVMIFRALATVPSMDRRTEYCREKGFPTSQCSKFEVEFFKNTAKKEKASRKRG